MRVDRQIRFESGYVWTWKFLCPQRKSCGFKKNTGYVWTGLSRNTFGSREFQNLTSPTILVVYLLHGQTCGSTVWVNGTQNSWLVRFVPGSRLPFVQISYIYRKTTAKAWNWYQRLLWRNGTRISVWNILFGKTGLPFQMFRCSRKFSAGTTQKVVCRLLFNRVFRKLFENGKQHLCPRN